MIPPLKKRGWSIGEIEYSLGSSSLNVDALGAAVPHLEPQLTDGAGEIGSGNVDLDTRSSVNYRKKRKTKKSVKRKPK